MENAVEKIKKYLKDNKLSREFLCNRYDVSLSYVAKWLTGKRPIPKDVQEDFESILKEKERIAIKPESVIMLRVDDKKYRQLEREALRLGLTLSEYMLSQGMKGLGMSDKEISEVLNIYKDY